jgi:hypothetical protein
MLLIDDGRSRRELLLVGTMVVGRDPSCEISHADPRLSRRHAEFRIVPDGVLVRDLDSRNGIRVNEQPVKQAVLRPGDTVQIAHLALTFREEDAAAFDTVLVPQAAPRASQGTAPPVSQPPVEDDRTRIVQPTQPMAALRSAPGAEVRPEVADDRTRVVPPPAPARAAPPPAPRATPARPPLAPTDVGDLVFRDAALLPEVPPAPVMSLQALAGRGWGRRVLAQGLLLAIVVFTMACLPLLAWQARAGIAALESWTVLLPAALASAFAGVMIASLIARTTARGLDGERR